MPLSVRSQMILLPLGFLILVTGSVIATFVGLQTMAKDALIINLAGRQRMLVHQMTRDVLRVDREGGEAYLPTLQETAHTFDQTLRALMEGGQVPYPPDHMISVPPIQRPDIHARLEAVQATWETFRNYLDVIRIGDPDSPDFRGAVQTIDRLSLALVQQADDVVRMYEATSAQKIARLRRIQIAFGVSALVLLAMGFWATQKSMIEPLQALGTVAERIGRGDLNTPVEVPGPREMELLAHSFDTMRAPLHSSQAALTTWAEELEARVAQRTRELAALYEVSREISSQLDINRVLCSVTDKARELLGGEVALLCLLDDAGRALKMQAISGPQEALCQTRVPAQDQPAARVLEGREAVRCGVGDCAGACGMIAAPFRISHLAAPLRVKERVIGALCVGSPGARTFPDNATNLLTKLANSAAIALENARLYQQAERVAVLEERERIAAEMHDGLAQTLSYLHLQVDQVVERIAACQAMHRVYRDEEAALAGPSTPRPPEREAGGGQATSIERRPEPTLSGLPDSGEYGEVGLVEELSASLEQVRERLARAADEVRTNIADLSTSPPPPRVLPKLLADAAREAATGRQNAELLVTTAGLEDWEVVTDVAESIRRIVQEAVTNACRHAEASQIQVRLEAVDGEAVIVVQDDGRGFEPDQAPADGQYHFGLSTMRARAARIGGRLVVESAPGRGTRVTLGWPLGERGRGNSRETD